MKTNNLHRFFYTTMTALTVGLSVGMITPSFGMDPVAFERDAEKEVFTKFVFLVCNELKDVFKAEEEHALAEGLSAFTTHFRTELEETTTTASVLFDLYALERPVVLVGESVPRRCGKEAIMVKFFKGIILAIDYVCKQLTLVRGVFSQEDICQNFTQLLYLNTPAAYKPFFDVPRFSLVLFKRYKPTTPLVQPEERPTAKPTEHQGLGAWAVGWLTAGRFNPLGILAK